MKKFLINLLILLSSPLYIAAVIILSMLSLGLKAGREIARLIDKWIKFMNSDYIQAYEIIKKKFKK